MDRTLVKSGPAILTWNGATLYFKSGLTIEESVSEFNVECDAMIAPDRRVDDRVVTFSGTPVGAWKDLDVLFPWLGASPGARLFGASDKAAVVHFLDGDKYTYHNTGLTKMPNLFFSPMQTLLGPVEFEARTKKDTAASANNSLFTRTTQSFSDTSFDLAEILTLPYTLNFGSSPWDSFDTEGGVEIIPTLQWRDIVSDKHGVVEKELTGLEVAAQFVPLGIAQSDIDAKLALQNSAYAVRGARRSGVGADFVISATGVYVELRNASLRKARLQSGRNVNRHGAVEAVASLEVATGAAVAQLFVGTEAPV